MSNKLNIYFAHSTKPDFLKLYYQPILNSPINQSHQIILPHLQSDQPFNSKSYLKSADLVIAEVSFPSTGLGIELGWADCFQTTIHCIYQKTTKPSSSLQVVSKSIQSYQDTNDQFIEIVEKIISSHET